LLPKYQGCAVLGIYRCRCATYAVTKFDYSRLVGRRVGHYREKVGLAGLVKSVELDDVHPA
jgi:hypothetical protein